MENVHGYATMLPLLTRPTLSRNYDSQNSFRNGYFTFMLITERIFIEKGWSNEYLKNHKHTIVSHDCCVIKVEYSVKAAEMMAFSKCALICLQVRYSGEWGLRFPTDVWF